MLPSYCKVKAKKMGEVARHNQWCRASHGMQGCTYLDGDRFRNEMSSAFRFLPYRNVIPIETKCLQRMDRDDTHGSAATMKRHKPQFLFLSAIIRRIVQLLSLSLSPLRILGHYFTTDA